MHFPSNSSGIVVQQISAQKYSWQSATELVILGVAYGLRVTLPYGVKSTYARYRENNATTGHASGWGMIASMEERTSSEKS
jgi:hypothetical protein